MRKSLIFFLIILCLIFLVKANTIEQNRLPNAITYISNINTTSALLTATTDNNASCRYSNGNVSYDNMSNFEIIYITHMTSHYVSLTGLSSSTAYTYYVRCRDSAGNEALNSTSFITREAVCEANWVLNGTWSECKLSSQSKNYYDANNCSNSSGQPASINQSCNDKIPPTIKVTNPLNNSMINTNSILFTLTTDEPAYCYEKDFYSYPTNDTTPPIISDPSPTGNISSTGFIELSIRTDEWATCKGSLNLDNSYENMEFDFSGYKVIHQEMIYLSESGEYTVFVKCRDLAGNTMPESYHWSFDFDYIPPQGGSGGGGGGGGGATSNYTFAHQWKYTNLTDGFTYLVWATCKDRFNNENTIISQFGVDIDNLFGNLNDVSSNINKLNLTIGGSTDYSQIFSEKQLVSFKEGNQTITEFMFDFDSSLLNLSDMSLIKQDNNSSWGFLIIKGLGELPSGETKTVYLDNLHPNNVVCVRDEEVASVSEITRQCNGVNEVVVPCTGKLHQGYTCTEIEGRYKIEGLKHSGVKEINCSESWSCIDWSACSGGTQFRTCSDGNACGTMVSKPDESQSCNSGESSSGSSGGGGGGGGGGGSRLLAAEVKPCAESWSCTAWTDCEDGFQKRSCNDVNKCETAQSKPEEERPCSFIRGTSQKGTVSATSQQNQELAGSGKPTVAPETVGVGKATGIFSQVKANGVGIAVGVGLLVILVVIAAWQVPRLRRKKIE